MPVGYGFVVAIDGPAGSGKSTLARSLATALGLPYLNTGLMYRALTLTAQRHGVAASDETGLLEMFGSMSFSVTTGMDPDVLSIFPRYEEDELDSIGVEADVSEVSRHPRVREAMRVQQRRLGEQGAVMEGRDIASVVFPDAELKIYLEASPEVRVERRVAERADAGASDAPTGTAEALHGRDARDSQVNAFEPVDGAIVIDTNGLSTGEVLEIALSSVRGAGGRA